MELAWLVGRRHRVRREHQHMQHDQADHDTMFGPCFHFLRAREDRSMAPSVRIMTTAQIPHSFYVGSSCGRPGSALFGTAQEFSGSKTLHILERIRPYAVPIVGRNTMDRRKLPFEWRVPQNATEWRSISSWAWRGRLVFGTPCRSLAHRETMHTRV